ncbi:hypothetical protein L211DRAFT_899000 [Terfezia boudieri ATCC MYA-4762]|uniref:Uncharacterized protein n=1 Tax=Terfezia boudieri ATCC MYA-4762 TaxID=1051890 RepID=A0A3N4LCH4_9PEZI|nr:hypothetical protein L211DRAFT_899000 [Terfezia boudieri ATCC MYA-4762]
MSNKKTMPAIPDSPKTQNPPKSKTLKPTPPSSKNPDSEMSAEGQKHLNYMYDTINEMLAKLKEDKMERKKSRLSRKKEKSPMGEDHGLFTQLQEMINQDKYLLNPGNQGDDKNPETICKIFQHHEFKGKGKGKLEVKINKREEGEGEEVETPLRSPQECYPYCI